MEGDRNLSRSMGEAMIIKNLLTGENLDAELSYDTIQIFKLDYHGDFHRSENGRYILSWSDIAENGLQGGAREKGHGRYLLIDDASIILQGKLERPNDGKVSNQGIFILGDWMFSGEYAGTFYAFDAKGKKLVRHRVTANLGENGISADGEYAVCQTYASQTEDGNKIFFFDLRKQTLLWKKDIETGLPNNFRFDIDNRILSLLDAKGELCRYSFDGDSLDSRISAKGQSEASSGSSGDLFDAEEWESESSQSYGGYHEFEIAMKKKKELDSSPVKLDSYNDFFSLMEKALNRGVSEYYQAMIYRAFGEVYQRLEIIDKTIEHYEKALSLYPNIGVKKKLQNLKEQLNKD